MSCNIWFLSSKVSPHPYLTFNIHWWAVLRFSEISVCAGLWGGWSVPHHGCGWLGQNHGLTSKRYLLYLCHCVRSRYNIFLEYASISLATCYHLYMNCESPVLFIYLYVRGFCQWRAPQITYVHFQSAKVMSDLCFLSYYIRMHINP